MAWPAPLDFPTPFWSSELWRQILQLRQKEYHELFLSGVQLEFLGFFKIPLQLCFLLSSCGLR